MMKNALLWENKEDFAALRRILREGGTAITATDTVYGFLAHATPHTLKKLQAIKDNRSKPFLVLAAPRSLNKLAIIPNHPGIRRIIDTCWPGPLTIVFAAAPHCPAHLVSDAGTIAIRVPGHDELLALLEEFDALFSTSANYPGCAPPRTIEEVDPNLIQHVDALVMSRTPVQTDQPSTILDLSDPSHPRLLREGACTQIKLEHLYGRPFAR